MNKQDRVSNLFYCLIGDIRDQLSFDYGTELQSKLKVLEEIREKYKKQTLDKKDLKLLDSIKKYFEQNEFKSFTRDIKLIITFVCQEMLEVL